MFFPLSKRLMVTIKFKLLPDNFPDEDSMHISKATSRQLVIKGSDSLIFIVSLPLSGADFY